MAVQVYVIGVFGAFGLVRGFAVSAPQVGFRTTFTFAGSVLLFGFESHGLRTVAIFE